MNFSRILVVPIVLNSLNLPIMIRFRHAYRITCIAY